MVAQIKKDIRQARKEERQAQKEVKAFFKMIWKLYGKQTKKRSVTMTIPSIVFEVEQISSKPVFEEIKMECELET